MDYIGAAEGVNFLAGDPDSELVRQRTLKRLHEEFKDSDNPARMTKRHNSSSEDETGTTDGPGAPYPQNVDDTDRCLKKPESSKNLEELYQNSDTNGDISMAENIPQCHSASSAEFKNLQAENPDSDSGVNYTVSHHSPFPSDSHQEPPMLNLKEGIPGFMFKSDDRWLFFSNADPSKPFLDSSKEDTPGSIVISGNNWPFPVDIDTTVAEEILLVDQNDPDSHTEHLHDINPPEDQPLESEAAQEWLERPFQGSIEDLEFSLHYWKDEMPKLLKDLNDPWKMISTPEEVSEIGKILIQLAYGIYPCKENIEKRREVFSELRQGSRFQERSKINMELKKFIIAYIEDHFDASLNEKSSTKRSTTKTTIAEKALRDGITALIQDANRVKNNKDGRLPGGGRVKVGEREIP